MKRLLIFSSIVLFVTVCGASGPGDSATPASSPAKAALPAPTQSIPTKAAATVTPASPTAAPVPPTVTPIPYEALVPLFDYDQTAPLDIQETKVTNSGGNQVHEISYVSPKGGG